MRSLDFTIEPRPDLSLSRAAESSCSILEAGGDIQAIAKFGPGAASTGDRHDLRPLESGDIVTVPAP